MNCANHPDVAAIAYCQTCGKPLCAGCMRSVGGVVYCEPCLAARLSPAAAAAMPATGITAHPVLAGLLGFIPGVGAMYNGQFVKALAHVLIFAVFVSLSDKNDFFSLLCVAWVFYQVFDAAQTAKARRDGLPLPNPFGLNDLGVRLGMTPAPLSPPYAGGFSSTGAAAGPTVTVDPVTGHMSGPATGQGPGAGGSSPSGASAPSVSSPEVFSGPGYSSPGYSSAAYPASGSATSGGLPHVSPLAGTPPAQRAPVGAIVLILVGAVLLLHTLGVFEDEWIGRAWPVLIIGVGAWLLYSRTRGVPRGGA